jgi:peptide-methionine (R)-S-oxide reductase
MDRRLFIAGAITAVTSLAGGRGVIAATDSSPMKGDFPPIVKTREEWRQLLQAQQYQVLFEEGTERPWTSPLNDEKRDGTYICATKFDSGTGWPSFYQAIEGNTGIKRDWKLIIPRTEYHCARCGGHQGHVFDDGPQPTGQRWCNNGVALRFIPSGEELPALRM